MNTAKPSKLTKEQIDQVYLMYYSPDPTRPRPTIEYLAHLFSISKSRLHLILNREHQQRGHNLLVEPIEQPIKEIN